MFRSKKQPTQTRKRPDVRRPASSKNFSYYTSSDIRSDKRPEQTIDLSGRPKFKLRLLPTYVAVAVILGSVLFSLTLSPTPQIDTLSGQQLIYHNAKEYADAASQFMKQRFGNHTKFSVDTNRVEEQLLELFPELRTAAIRLPVIGRKPTLVVDIRQPVLLLVTNRQSLVLDATGVAVAEASGLAAERLATLQVVHDENDIEYELGNQAVTSETVHFIKAVKAQFDAQSLQIDRLTLPRSANQLDVKPSGLGYYVKMDISADARLQIGSFLAVKEQGTTPSEYMDVRVPEKVFYK